MSEEKRETIRHRGKDHPILRRLRIGDRAYFLTKRLSHPDRERYRAICPQAPPDERLCCVFLFSRDKASMQHLQALRRISRHDNGNFPRILSMEKQRHCVAVATRWIPGTTLDKYLLGADDAFLGGRSPTDIMMRLRGLALGLRQLHKHRGLIHGDIKPGNLVLTGKPQRIVMIDFGSAWMKSRTAAKDEGDGHSRLYAAPEQLADTPGPLRAVDQFSASLVAYELMTGELPYGGMGGKAGLPRNRPAYEPQWEPPSKLSPHKDDVPARVWNRIDAILRRALSLSPEERYLTDKDWIEDLSGLQSEIHRKTEPIPGHHWVLRCGEFFSRLLKLD